MTDLHTHILPGLDDGAKELGSALAMLEHQAGQGVTRIALTSHYHCELEALDDFLARREEAFRALAQVCPPELTLKRGCEVYYSPELLGLEAERLCLEGTRVLLLELPVLQKPAFLREVLAGLAARGILPLIAHAERYAYVAEDPTLLADWIALGARIQVNAGSLMEGQRLAMKLVKWGLAHVIASDAHSLQYRPANLRRGMDAVAKALGPEKARELEHNAAMIFSGRGCPAGTHQTPKKILGFWF